MVNIIVTEEVQLSKNTTFSFTLSLLVVGYIWEVVTVLLRSLFFW